jgi:hypothetical protein
MSDILQQHIHSIISQLLYGGRSETLWEELILLDKQSITSHIDNNNTISHTVHILEEEGELMTGL